MNSYEDEQKLINLLGQALYTVWSELCKAIDAVYEMEHIWNNGGKAWKCEYKFRKGGKTLCALYAQENRMGFLMIFGKDERAKFEAARHDYSGYIQNIYDNAKTYHDGKWILFEPVDCSLFDEFLRLLAIKRKPNKK